MSDAPISDLRWWKKKEIMFHDVEIWVDSYLMNNDFPFTPLEIDPRYPTVKELHDKMVKRFNSEL